MDGVISIDAKTFHENVKAAHGIRGLQLMFGEPILPVINLEYDLSSQQRKFHHEGLKVIKRNYIVVRTSRYITLDNDVLEGNATFKHLVLFDTPGEPLLFEKYYGAFLL